MKYFRNLLLWMLMPIGSVLLHRSISTAFDPDSPFTILGTLAGIIVGGLSGVIVLVFQPKLRFLQLQNPLRHLFRYLGQIALIFFLLVFTWPLSVGVEALLAWQWGDGTLIDLFNLPAFFLFGPFLTFLPSLVIATVLGTLAMVVLLVFPKGSAHIKASSKFQ